MGKRLTQFSTVSDTESFHAARLCRQLERGGLVVADALEAPGKKRRSIE